MVVSVFDIEVKLDLFTWRLQRDKLHKSYIVEMTELNKLSMKLLEMYTLTCLLFLCTKVVLLSKVYMQLLQDLVAKFLLGCPEFS